MTTLTSKHFDTLAYVKQARKLGTSEELAEFQAKQIEQAIDVAISQIESKDLATKKDIKELELKIESTKNQIILWVGGLVMASGLLQHFFTK
jgi:hypothetical protein